MLPHSIWCRHCYRSKGTKWRRDSLGCRALWVVPPARLHNRILVTILDDLFVRSNRAAFPSSLCVSRIEPFLLCSGGVCNNLFAMSPMLSQYLRSIIPCLISTNVCSYILFRSSASLPGQKVDQLQHLGDRLVICRPYILWICHLTLGYLVEYDRFVCWGD